MGSALAMWAYHRRLSEEIKANQIKTPNESEPLGIEKKERRRRSSQRTVSESSSVAPDERRVSIDPAEEDSDEETNKAAEHTKHANPTKGHRRFSLEFLFNKKGKNKKDKSKEKQSSSIAVQQQDEDDAHVREMRYPGLAANDFSMFYFI